MGIRIGGLPPSPVASNDYQPDNGRAPGKLQDRDPDVSPARARSTFVEEIDLPAVETVIGSDHTHAF